MSHPMIERNLARRKEKCAAVLALLDDKQLSLAQIVEATGFNYWTCVNVLTALRKAGLVKHTRNSGYELIDPVAEEEDAMPIVRNFLPAGAWGIHKPGLRHATPFDGLMA